MMHTEILGDQPFVSSELRSRAGENATTRVENDCGVGYIKRQLEILLDQNDGLLFCLQPANGPAYFGYDQRGQAFGWFVQQEHARIAHQCPTNRQHLLLTSGKRSRELRVAFLQPRKKVVEAIHGPWCHTGLASLCRHNEILAYRKRGEDTASLRDKSDPEARDAFGAQTDNLLPMQPDFTFARLQQADDAGNAGGLTRAISAEQSENGTRSKRKAYIMQDMTVAIECVNVGQAESVRCQDTPLAFVRR